MIIFDLDDQSDQYNALPKLLELKELLPNLKVNLFTIPNKTSQALLEELKSHDWIRLIPHGINHDTNYEFSQYTENEAIELLYNLPRRYYDRGFKAPGWQISEGVMKALRDLDMWLATEWSDGRLNGDINGPYRPAVIPNLRYYSLHELPEDIQSIHGHTWNTCGNGIEEIWDQLIALPKESEFMFIDDYIEKKYG